MRTPGMRVPASLAVTAAQSAAFFKGLASAKAESAGGGGSVTLGCWPASGSVATPGCVGATVGPSAQSPGVQLAISNGFFSAPAAGAPAGSACKGTTPIPGCAGSP